MEDTGDYTTVITTGHPLDMTRGGLYAYYTLFAGILLLATVSVGSGELLL